MIEQRHNSLIGNISQKLLEGYMSHPAIGYEMGFAAVTREDFKSGVSFSKAFDRLCKRIVVFESPVYKPMGENEMLVKDPCENGRVLQDTKIIDEMKLSSEQYVFAIATLARWLPICLMQLSGVHEPFVKMSISESKVVQKIGRGTIMILGEGFYWLGYALFPNFCNDMNDKLPIGLRREHTLQSVARQQAIRDLWRK